MKSAPLACLLALLLTGCSSRPSEAARSAPDEDLASAADLPLLLQQLNRDVRALPGENELEYLRTLQQVFVDLSAVLPELAEPSPPGAFRQQVEILQRLPDRIAAVEDEQRLGAPIATGVRTTYLALAGIHQRRFANDEATAELLGQLQDRLQGIDITRGPIQRLSVYRAMIFANAVVERLAELHRQAGLPTAEPSSGPPTQPAGLSSPQ